MKFDKTETKCPVCNKTYKNHTGWVVHMERKHADSEQYKEYRKQNPKKTRKKGTKSKKATFEDFKFIYENWDKLELSELAKETSLAVATVIKIGAGINKDTEGQLCKSKGDGKTLTYKDMTKIIVADAKKKGLYKPSKA